ncbi:hypothetical protein R3P38DRAFT_2605600 [Favolaschia claudopus]|uniref:Uncharacterized protein n=1 Tax=Favolaschia claudopus TaxID=2862362 RepID=A0AAW0DDW2_9AGAR
MHDCWLVAELTRAIFEELREHDHLQSADQAAGGSSIVPVSGACSICLSRVALVCRQFLEPALDLLWEKQSELDNLLKCLPSNTWISSHKFEIIIQSPINQKARDRLSFYAKRIRSFETIRGGALHESVLETLSIWGKQGPLLPNVRDVLCETGSPLFPVIPLLVGSAVTEIEIQAFNGPARRLMALPLIAAQSPDLSVVRIGVAPNEAKEWILRFVLPLMRLRNLYIGLRGMTETTFRRLVGVKSLQTLQISSIVSTVGLPLDMDNILKDGVDTFAALRHLDFSAATTDVALRLVELVPMAPLETLFIHTVQTSRQANIKMLCLGIAAGQRIAHLTSIFLNFDRLPPNAMKKITGNAIQPLFTLRNLRFVNLRFPSDPALDDEFFEELAQSWPSLQTLLIQGLKPLETESASPSYPSILCLIPLSRGCPDLSYMKLSLDATVVPLHTSSRLPRTIQTVLKKWVVSHSPISSEHAVAAFLSSIFPSLSIVTSQENGHNSAWRNAQTLLSAFTSIREDERSMLASSSAES